MADAGTTTGHFVRKLRHGARLTAADEEVLLGLVQPVLRIAARRDILAEGAEPRWLPLIVKGWACRHRLLANGKRQIVSLFLPGDLCELFGALPHPMDTSIESITPVVVAPVPPEAIRGAARASSTIDEALWWNLMVASAIEREHIVSLGRRSASERLGHLICELHLRLAMVGLADRGGYDMPVTQTDLSDLLGLSAVHVNRSLQELRKQA